MESVAALRARLLEEDCDLDSLFDVMGELVLAQMAECDEALTDLLAWKDQLLAIDPDLLPPSCLMNLMVSSGRLHRATINLEAPVIELVRMVRQYSQPWNERYASMEEILAAYNKQQRQLEMAVNMVKVAHSDSERSEQEQLIQLWERLFAKATSHHRNGARWRFALQNFKGDLLSGKAFEKHLQDAEAQADDDDDEDDEDAAASSIAGLMSTKIKAETLPKSHSGADAEVMQRNRELESKLGALLSMRDTQTVAVQVELLSDNSRSTATPAEIIEEFLDQSGCVPVSRWNMRPPGQVNRTGSGNSSSRRPLNNGHGSSGGGGGGGGSGGGGSGAAAADADNSNSNNGNNGGGNSNSNNNGSNNNNSNSIGSGSGSGGAGVGSGPNGRGRSSRGNRPKPATCLAIGNLVIEVLTASGFNDTVPPDLICCFTLQRMDSNENSDNSNASKNTGATAGATAGTGKAGNGNGSKSRRAVLSPLNMEKAFTAATNMHLSTNDGVSWAEEVALQQVKREDLLQVEIVSGEAHISMAVGCFPVEQLIGNQLQGQAQRGKVRITTNVNTLATVPLAETSPLIRLRKERNPAANPGMVYLHVRASLLPTDYVPPERTATWLPPHSSIPAVWTGCVLPGQGPVSQEPGMLRAATRNPKYVCREIKNGNSKRIKKNKKELV
jgi:hypothetical protein